MKTYSIAIKDKAGTWFTNWHEYYELAEINFDKVLAFCIERGHAAYGYYYGHKSSDLTSGRCRTVLAELLPA
jgi:hypothetical protein